MSDRENVAHGASLAWRQVHESQLRRRIDAEGVGFLLEAWAALEARADRINAENRALTERAERAGRERDLLYPYVVLRRYSGDTEWWDARTEHGSWRPFDTEAEARAYVGLDAAPAGACPRGGEHQWGIDGQHGNEYCKRCFESRSTGETGGEDE